MAARTFRSFARDFVIGQGIMNGFLPELFIALKEEKDKRKLRLELKPNYDILLVRELPGGKHTFAYYYPKQERADDIYTARVDILASVFAPGKTDAFYGNVVLATLPVTTTVHNLHVNPFDNLAVDPEVLYRVAEKHKPQ